MSAVPLAFEIVGLFMVTLCLLYKYSDFRRQNKIALGAVFIAWYFSFMIIFILPMDISLTTYHQCQRDHENKTDNQSATKFCKEPFSLLGPRVLPVLWRIIYWTSQALTWLILPFMQMFSQSGEFTLSGKIRGALIANAIYYGTYMAIFSVLLIYVAINYHIDGQKLKVIGITASNTWGLFLLVLLLGYGLVGVPRSLWYKSITSLHLRQIYFKLAKLHGEKCDAEETLEDILNDVRTVAEKIKYNNSLRSCVDKILLKCPESFKSTIRRNLEDYSEYDDSSSSARGGDFPTEKSLVKLHTKLIKALGVKNRTANQWVELIDEAFEVEDILTNETNSNRTFFRTAPYQTNALEQQICNPTLEWLYYCIIKKYSLKLLSVVLAGVTIMVIWSEMTFFSKKPPLSLFAIFLNYSRLSYNYLIIEFVCCLTIAYLCFCAYYTIFKMRIFNYFYLTPNHQTNENSLIFSGTLFCRLTSPLCYNFLGLVHLDSHITKNTQIVETQFTTIMGHMDVISFISDGFNIYFPILIFVFCVANFFELGGHLLNFLGFEQFLTDNELTHDLVEDGKNLVKREKRRLERNDPEVQLRHRDVANRLLNNYSSLSPPNSSLQNSSEAPSVRSAGGGEMPQSSSDKVASALSSVRSAISSSLPAFLVNKSASQKFKFTPSRVKEYRDIPAYSDEPASNNENAGLTEEPSVSRSSRGGYLTTTTTTDEQAEFGRPARDELFGNKNSSGSVSKNPRNIFDDI